MIPALVKGLLAVWLCCASLPATAAMVADLYETTVPVSGEDQASRNQAIGQALARVLVKLTGRDPVPGASDLIEQAPSYVQQYRYQRSLTPDGQSRTALWVRFDKLGLDRAIRGRGLPLWGESRPGMLVWLGAERDGRRELLGADADLAIATRAAAAGRGLPVQWPLMDLEDQARLTSADLWSDYAEAVKQASARYAEPLVLTGRLRQAAPDHWEGRWTLYQDGGTRTLTSSGSDGAMAVTDAIAQLADQLAARYAPAGGGGEGVTTVRLQLNGVHGVAGYARALQQVGELDVVDRVLLRRATGDSLELAVLARGGRDALARVLDLTRGLVREPDPPPPPPQLPAPVLPVQPIPPVTPPAEQAGAPVVDAAEAAGAEVQPLTPAPPPPPPPVDLVYRVTL